jgi:hypothetical protein
MAVSSIASDTGSAVLPDLGILQYNDILFSSLYSSVMSGEAILDNANRTVKYIKYTLTVDGVVTLNDQQNQLSIDGTWEKLRADLQVCAGTLFYDAKGFGVPFIVNKPGGTLFDVAWGPIPKLLDFVPLGGSRSARIKWTITFCIPEIPATTELFRVLQFNNETFLSYDEAGFSHITIRGTLEIPLTRPTQQTKTLNSTVDDFRQEFMARITAGFDLTRFQVSKRDFDISRDKRTLEWSFQLDELGWMGLPGGILEADGSVTMRPYRPGLALAGKVQWLMTIRATYIVPNGQARRLAYLAFLAMWNYRMRFSEFAFINPNGGVANAALGNQAPLVNIQANAYAAAYNNRVNQIATAAPGPANTINVFNQAVDALPNPNPNAKTNSMPVSIGYEEGLYKNSKTISFEASWFFTTLMSNLLVASGLWRKTGLEGGQFWAQSVANITGGSSWLENKLDRAGAVIVDFGG